MDFALTAATWAWLLNSNANAHLAISHYLLHRNKTDVTYSVDEREAV